jgi:hypothetical protein
MQRRRNNNNNKKRNKLTRVRRPATLVTARNNYAQSAVMVNPTTRIPRMIDPRYIDINLGMSVVSLWTLVDMTPVTQGVGDTQRLGRYTRLNRAELQFTIDAQNADVFTTVRFLVVQWVPQSSNQPFTMNEVLQLANDVNSFYNVDAGSGYKILHDEKLAMSGTITNPTISGFQTIYRRVNLRRANKNQLYAIGTVTSFNKLFFVAISNSNISPFPAIVGYSRVYFST